MHVQVRMLLCIYRYAACVCMCVRESVRAYMRACMHRDCCGEMCACCVCTCCLCTCCGEMCAYMLWENVLCTCCVYMFCLHKHTVGMYVVSVFVYGTYVCACMHVHYTFCDVHVNVVCVLHQCVQKKQQTCH